MRELEQFSSHDLFQAMHARNAVAKRNDGANFIHGNFRFVVFDLLPD